MNLGLTSRLVLVIFTTSLIQAQGAVLEDQIAQVKVFDKCDEDLRGFVPLTLKRMREAAKRAAESVRKICPAPNHQRIEIARFTEQIRDPWTPKFMDEIMPEQNGLVACARDTSPDEASVGIIDRAKTFPVFVQTKLNKRSPVTTAFVTKAQRFKRKDPSVKKHYMIDNTHEIAQVHLHGGGTKTTGAHSGTETGEAILDATGAPFLSFDLPFHADATKDAVDLETCEKQADLILKYIDEMIHPDVKIQIYGHSWGAQFVIYMWQHRFEPKFARIIEYIAGSPPPDPSVGGDPAKKLEFEMAWEHDRKKFDHLMAPSDRVFLDNVLENGKFSSVAALGLRLSDRDYFLPKMTWAEVKRGPRLTIVMGTKDGVCYVGREHFFRESFPPEMFVDFDTVTDWESFMSDPNRPSRFILLGDHQNYKSRREGEDVRHPTGHQIGDFIIPNTIQNGNSGKRFLWELLSRSILAHHDQKPFVPNNDNALDSTLHSTAMALLRDTASRQLVRHGIEFVSLNAAGHETIRARLILLSKYVTQVEVVRKGRVDVERRYAREELNALSRELGLEEGLSVTGAEQKIKIEPVDEDTREVLQAYVNLGAEIEPMMRRPLAEGGWNDHESEADEKAAVAEAIQVLNEPTWTMDDVKNYLEQVKRRKGSGVPKPQRDALGIFDNRLNTINKLRKERFSAERNRRIANIPRPPNIDFDVIEADRRLNVERDPHRRELYATFVRRSGEAIERAQARRLKEEVEKIAQITPPEGLGSEQEVQQAIKEQRQLIDMTFAPANHPELQATVDRINQLRAANIPFTELERRANKTNELRKYRQGLLGRYNTVMAEKDSEKAVISPRVNEYWGTSKAELRQRYYDIYSASYHASGRHELELADKGELVGENIYGSYAANPEVGRLRDEYESLEAEFDRIRLPIAEMQRLDALEGKLMGHAANAQLATAAAREIWGEPSEENPEKNLTTRLRQMEEELEEAREASSKAEYLLGLERIRYLEQLRAANYPVPFTIYRVKIQDILDNPERLFAAMTGKDEESKVIQEALKLFKKRYDDMHAELSQINQGAKDD